MWFLISPDGQTSLELLPGKIYTVSRKTGDIILAGDGSVSRDHARLEVKNPVTDGIAVWDVSSKFGTYVNDGIDSNSRIQAGMKVTLEDGALVRFGLQHNTWKLIKNVPCVCAFMVKASDKNSIKSVLSGIGGEVVDKWTDKVTHLTTNSLRLTYEVICALLSLKPIVSPAYWQSYSLMINGNGPTVDVANFIPPIEDKRLIGENKLCLPNSERKVLLKDKIFIFTNPTSYQVWRKVVEMAGGKANNIANVSEPLEKFCEKNVVVLDCGDSEQTPLYKKVMRKLEEGNKRLISDEEIGLAIWAVSVGRYCNPSYLSKSLLRRSFQSEDMGKTLVPNSEDEAGSSSVKTEANDIVIPPTLSDDLFTSEDETMSYGLRAPHSVQSASALKMKKSPVRSSLSLRRRKDAENGISETKCLGESFKEEQETESERDLFEDELPEPRTKKRDFGTRSSLNQKEEEDLTLPSPPKRKRKSDDYENPDDVFKLPSPPRKKKSLQSRNDNIDFELPEAPPSAKPALSMRDEEDFDFSESSMVSRKSCKIEKVSHLDESVDLFGTLPSSETHASTSKGEKRKERCDPESVMPPSKSFKSSTDMKKSIHGTPSESTFKSQKFKESLSCLKSESTENCKLEEREVDESLLARFCTKVVITPLMIRRSEPNSSTSSDASSTVKNFKKFRKSGVFLASDRRSIITSRVHISQGFRFQNGNHSNSENEDEDNPSPNGPGPRRNMNNTEEDDEFKLPSFSQVS